MQRTSAIADLSALQQREDAVNTTPRHTTTTAPEDDEEEEEERLPDYEGLFEATPQQQGTPFSRMDAAFSQLESMWDELSRRASLPN